LYSFILAAESHPIPDSTGQTTGTDCSDGFATEAQQRREQKHRQCGQIGASPANAPFRAFHWQM